MHVSEVKRRFIPINRPKAHENVLFDELRNFRSAAK